MESLFTPEVLLVILAVAAVVWSVQRVSAVSKMANRQDDLNEEIIHGLLDECVLSYMVIGEVRPLENSEGLYFLPFAEELRTEEGAFTGVAAMDRKDELFLVTSENTLVYSGDLTNETLFAVRRNTVRTISLQVEKMNSAREESTKGTENG